MQGIDHKDRTKVTLVPWTGLQQEDSDAQLLFETKARIAVLTDLVRQQLVAYDEDGSMCPDYTALAGRVSRRSWLAELR